MGLKLRLDLTNDSKKREQSSFVDADFELAEMQR